MQFIRGNKNVSYQFAFRDKNKISTNYRTGGGVRGKTTPNKRTQNNKLFPCKLQTFEYNPISINIMYSYNITLFIVSGFT